VALLPLILLTGPRLHLRVALLLALVAVTYPVLRGAGLVPVDAILAQVQAFNPERAQSFGFRLQNETALLERAQEKLWFGWGGWGRNLILDSETGSILSIPDGRWIIVLGSFGWLGYLSEFGLLALPLVLLAWRGAGSAALSPLATPLALILAITMIDMLLNATLVPMTWLIAGALLGHAETLARQGAPASRRGTSRPGRTVM
jgi:hypothetical protein